MNEKMYNMFRSNVMKSNCEFFYISKVSVNGKSYLSIFIEEAMSTVYPERDYFDIVRNTEILEIAVRDFTLTTYGDGIVFVRHSMDDGSVIDIDYKEIYKALDSYYTGNVYNALPGDGIAFNGVYYCDAY